MKMNLTLQRLLKAVTFLLIFAFLFSYATNVLTLEENRQRSNLLRVDAFYALPKDSIDVLFLGASSFRQGIYPLVLWEEEGFTSYVRATGLQSPAVTYYYLVESLKYQHPSVVVIDPISLWQYYDMDEREPFVRWAVDPLRLSIPKIQLISDVVSVSKGQTVTDYLFPLLRFHSRWKELTMTDFEEKKEHRFRGAVYDARVQPQELPADFMEPTTGSAFIDENSLQYYLKTIQLCRENGIEVVFISLPRTTSTYEQYNAIQTLAETYDFTYIDYNLAENLEAVHFDESVDFADFKHLSYSGAIKLTHAVGDYLQDRFRFEDKRDDPAFQWWYADLQYFYDVVNGIEPREE